MGRINFKFFWTILLLHMFGTSLCTMSVKQYRLDLSATRVASAGFLSLTGSGLSKVRCFAECTGNSGCFYVSFYNLHGICIMSSCIDGSGWALFRLNPPGPDIGEFVSVGNHNLVISDQRVNKAEAECRCSSFGFGRLVEIRSEQMYIEISNYLKDLSQSMKDLYGDIWIAGVYSSGSYMFLDGGRLQITDANSFDTDGNLKCLTLRSDKSFKYDDRLCSYQASYMCEQI